MNNSMGGVGANVGVTGYALDPAYEAALHNRTVVNTGGATFEPFGIAPGNVIDNTGRTFLDKAVPLVTAAGVGAAFGPVIAGALTPAGTGAVASGAISGGTTGAITGGTGAGLTGQNVGKGVLIGGVTGALGGALKPVASGATNELTNSGVNPTLAQGITTVGTGAVKGAVGAALGGGNVTQGATGGAIGAGTGSVAGSVFSNGGTIFSGGTAAQPSPPALTTPQAPGTMSADDGLDYIDPTGQYAYQNADGTVSGGGSGGGGYYDTTDPIVQQNVNAGQQAYNGGNPGVGVTGGTVSGGSLLGSLAKYLTGGGGGSGGGANLLAQLLGLGATGIGGALQSSAARSAANNFGAATRFNPFNVTTNNGTVGFNGTNATATLSPGAQAQSNALNGLVSNSAAALNKGPTAAANGYFNLLQQEDQPQNDRFLQGTKDNEFANGIFSSTPGQYQTQAALDAINRQTTQNQITANNFANTQQQNQLAQLTGGLNGLNNLNASQLAALRLGSDTGSAASGANAVANEPILAANSGSNIGNLLVGLGNGVSNSNANNNALAQYLASIYHG